MSSRIAKAELADAPAIRCLIMRAVNPEHNPDFNEEGIKRFWQPNELSAIQARLNDAEYLTLCAFVDEVLVGVITMHRYQKLDQLFVDPEYRNRRIATDLWLAAKARCCANGVDSGYWVKSSTMAVPVYQRFGFGVEGEKQSQFGICYYLMRYV